MITMFQSFNTFNRKQQNFTNPVVNELSVKLRMPACYQGKAVPTSIVVMELLWQQYGLDMIHPEVSLWLEKNAPDVKYMAAKSQFARGNDSTEINVGPTGIIDLHLSLNVDDRLREVSSQYILSQVQHSMEPETELPLAA
jgi:hypothetical protein